VIIASTTSISLRSTTTTTARPIITITRVGDTIIGLYNTIAGGPTGGSNGIYSSSPSEQPPSVIDGNTHTKYLNFGTGSVPGINTGFYITPAVSNTSVACALRFATANDSPYRDPITVTFEGSNNSSSVGALNFGSSWTLIYNGPTGISSIIDPGRSIYVAQQNFLNTIAYAHYRVLVTSKRGTDNSVQYSEVQIIGYV
jgi:hypothetical protein